MHNTSDEAQEWLEARLQAVPPALRTRITEVVQAVGPEASSVVEVFQSAADQLLRETLAERVAADALTLLAADALITYVCEYCSERQPESLMSLV